MELMTKKNTVLVIDDERIVGDALMTILSDCGYEVTVTRTGCEGIERASKQQFDFTITDFHLPDMTGLDVLSSIRKQYPCSLIIVITAYSTPEIIAESKRRGAIDVLSKPFSPADVLNILTKSLEKERL